MAAILRGFKEIGALCDGCSRPFFRQLCAAGLPVHCAGEGPGRRYWARRSELERWLSAREQERSRHTTSG